LKEYLNIQIGVDLMMKKLFFLLILGVFVAGCIDNRVGELRNGVIDCGKWNVTTQGIESPSKTCFLNAYAACKPAILDTFTKAGGSITYSSHYEITGEENGECNYTEKFENTNERGVVTKGTQTCNNLNNNFADTTCKLTHG
jgi:hypothetical protein